MFECAKSLKEVLIVHLMIVVMILKHADHLHINAIHCSADRVSEFSSEAHCALDSSEVVLSGSLDSSFDRLLRDVFSEA